jgi:hypothetical protein
VSKRVGLHRITSIRRPQLAHTFRTAGPAPLVFVITAHVERWRCQKTLPTVAGSLEGPALGARGPAFTVWGESQAMRGHLTEAMATLEQALILRRKIPGLSPWPTIDHLLAMGRVATAAGDLPRAEQLLDEARQVMSRFPDGMAAMRGRLTAAPDCTTPSPLPRAWCGSADRSRGRHPPSPSGSDEPERDRLPAVPLAQHSDDACPGHLPQARRRFSVRSGAHRPPRVDLTAGGQQTDHELAHARGGHF